MKKFLIIWVGELLSTIGSGLTAFGLGVYVYQRTGMATSTALVSLLALLPTVLLGPIAGVLADRYDRRKRKIDRNGHRQRRGAAYNCRGRLYVRYSAVYLPF